MTNIEKIDDYTVKMTFNKNYYPYLSELTYTRPCRMMSPTSVSPAGDEKCRISNANRNRSLDDRKL